MLLLHCLLQPSHLHHNHADNCSLTTHVFYQYMTIYTTFNKTITLLPTTQPSPINPYNHLPIPSTTSYKHQLSALIKHNIPLRNYHIPGFTYTQLWDNNLPSPSHPNHSPNGQVTQPTYIHAHGNCSPQTQHINN